MQATANCHGYKRETQIYLRIVYFKIVLLHFYLMPPLAPKVLTLCDKKKLYFLKKHGVIVRKNRDLPVVVADKKGEFSLGI